MRYALYLRYTSRQAYIILQEQFPLPSLSLLRKLHNGGVDPLKAIKLLLNEGNISADVALLLDEIYIQKEASYQEGEVVGKDEENNLYKGVMVFMIVGLRKSIPYVVRAVPEISINGTWLKSLIDETITCLHGVGFNVRLVVSDNHSTNVLAFNLLLTQYDSDMHNHYIQHHTKPNLKTYLVFDSVHLLKNIRNNLLNRKRFLFPSFKFDGFLKNVYVKSGEVDWHLLYNIYEKDESLNGNLRLAFKLSYNALHPGDNKQSFPLALSIFHTSTSAAIRSYYPEREDAASFLHLIDTWWVIANSKQRYNCNNKLGNAAVSGDQKPEFLRAFADWLEEWHENQLSNCEKYTLTTQTKSALIVTLRATASLIEDLLSEGYKYILTARFQTDPLELRFSKYRQMNGGRFLIGLRELLNSERILATRSLLKEDINVWKEDLQPSNDIFNELESDVKELEAEILESQLSEESYQAAVYIAGYVVKKLIERCKCNECISILKASSNDISHAEYLRTMSRGGLIMPSLKLAQHVSSGFSTLDLTDNLISKSGVPARVAAEHILKLFSCKVNFVCSLHFEWGHKYANRIITNIFYNNMQKQSKDHKRKEQLSSFKKRQRTK